ncbi:MAG TPA: hypothetical protein VFV35_05455, partial [Acidimicrobiales bacterium]|nr:hypothetical protein [Acidimicrobiales bacterium]
MGVRSLPGAVIDAGLDVLRRPLAAVGEVADRAGLDRFDPTIAYDALTGSLRERLGSAMRDRRLAERGREVREAARERARSIELREAAEEVEESAEA